MALDHAAWGFYVPGASTVATVFFGLLILSRKQNVSSSLAKITEGGFVVAATASTLATLGLAVLGGHSGAKLT